jgi:hypothetical protein
MPPQATHLPISDFVAAVLVGRMDVQRVRLRGRQVGLGDAILNSEFSMRGVSPNKSLQATRDGRSSSASRFTLVGPACLSSER